mmetsp:Transcript_46584/g.110378  ORF Transcript_46584/g.110378 Transcript_46584/m.110378 type:complete len:123 (-) Transcript_46584:70-438(-)|eukprot:CAMPEP_0177699798 /NCGR_PEP_ID=MMETSP0484_2-20121128/5768_1 /TAXON_ID=354590 /ORGANISM="Rhodomonas lens, Strain RHODO" /LENGTH=122 /DNA_ID=CAMNT_0019210985 /DNA_START=192 /DNA_END=560 /DNA_ORIENTATION=-
MSEWRLQTQNGMMGVCYMHLPKTMPDALEVARKGDPMAICNAGWCYFNGIKVPRDQRKALDLWRRAAEKSGNAGSSYNLGYCYSFGIVVKQDDQIASDWFAKYHRGRNTERLEYNVNRSSTD